MLSVKKLFNPGGGLAPFTDAGNEFVNKVFVAAIVLF